MATDAFIMIFVDVAQRGYLKIKIIYPKITQK